MDYDLIQKSIRIIRESLGSAVKFSVERTNETGCVFEWAPNLQRVREEEYERHGEWQRDIGQALDDLTKKGYPVPLGWQDIDVSEPQICFSRVPRETGQRIDGPTDKIWVVGSGVPLLCLSLPMPKGMQQLEAGEIFNRDLQMGYISGLFADDVVQRWKVVLSEVETHEREFIHAGVPRRELALDGAEAAKGAKRRYLTKEFADELGVSTKTLVKYAKIAGVRTAKRGQRNFEFTEVERLTILQAMSEKGGDASIRSNSTLLLNRQTE